MKIPNPVLTANWKRAAENRVQGRQRLNLAPDEQVILGVGQLQQRKGVEDFIDMATAIPDKKFVWVGGRPWGRFTEGVARINNRIRKAPENIQFPGLLDLENMPQIYAAADVFVFPSYQENCPLAPLEAAASGLPVIFRNLPEYRTLFHTPYLSAASTPKFISLIYSLLTNNETYKNAVQLSTQLLEDFDQDKIRNEIIRLYQEVIAASAQPAYQRVAR